MTDVAYIVGPPGREKNEELRYSLRSVDANLENVGEVIMFGHAPRWVKARTVEERPASKDKHRDARVHLAMACGSPDSSLSDPFWLFNDDFFVMKPMRKIPAVDKGEIALQTKTNHRAQQAVRHLMNMNIDEPYLLYECHTPILVYKRPMLDVIKMLPIGGLVKTVYMNLMGFVGEHTGNAKVYANTPRVWEDWPLLSTTDGTFATSEVGHFIRDRFPEPSRWEWPGQP